MAPTTSSPPPTKLSMVREQFTLSAHRVNFTRGGAGVALIRGRRITIGLYPNVPLARDLDLENN